MLRMETHFGAFFSFQTIGNSVARRDGDLDLRAGGEDRYLRLAAFCRKQFVGSIGTRIVIGLGAKLRQVLAGEAQNSRAISTLKRKLPAFGCFNGIAWAEGTKVRNAAQGSKMFNRLMGRSVFAKTD